MLTHPAKYALVGCDLGNTFHELLSIANAQSHSVLLTRAQTSALAVEDSERNAQQQADEGLPISLSLILIPFNLMMNHQMKLLLSFLVSLI